MSIRVDKEWGTEYWLCNEAEYCCKRLVIAVGKQCSLHFHKVKKETFIVETGQVRLQRVYNGQMIHDVVILNPGESVTLPPVTAHRFCAMGEVGATILEVSTHHDDADVVRIIPSGDKEEVW